MLYQMQGMLIRVFFGEQSSNICCSEIRIKSALSLMWLNEMELISLLHSILVSVCLVYLLGNISVTILLV